MDPCAQWEFPENVNIVVAASLGAVNN